MNKQFILIAFFSFLSLGLSAQVTIGSEIEPLEGALLDLKQNEANDGGQTATKGFVLPRVELEDKQSLAPLVANATSADKKAHTGLTVYNLKYIDGVAGSGGKGALRIGLNVWNGSEWIQVGGVSSAPNFFYMPAFKLESSQGRHTIDLYKEYRRQFSRTHTETTPYNFTTQNDKFMTGTADGANYKIPGLYKRYDLHYAVLEYDESILYVEEITPEGVLTYVVHDNSNIEGSYITVICVVKE